MLCVFNLYIGVSFLYCKGIIITLINLFFKKVINNCIICYDKIFFVLCDELCILLIIFLKSYSYNIIILNCFNKNKMYNELNNE